MFIKFARSSNITSLRSVYAMQIISHQLEKGIAHKNLLEEQEKCFLEAMALDLRFAYIQCY